MNRVITYTLACLLPLAASANAAFGSAEDHQTVLDSPGVHDPTTKWQDVWAFSGIATFAHLPHVDCLTQLDERFDIGIIGAPFDTSVSYRPGARFGPKAIRSASMRQTPMRSFHPQLGVNPYRNWAKVIDCGDIPVTPYDNNLAMSQMTAAYRELGARPAKYLFPGRRPGAVDGSRGEKPPGPRLISLGGDHSIILGALRALRDVHGPVTLVHFDSHLDTWSAQDYPSSWPEKSAATFTHGSMLWTATQEGLVSNDTSIHAGLRCRLSGTDYSDYDADHALGFRYLEASEMEFLGPKNIAQIIRQRVGDCPVYLSIDIDVIDPSQAPGTGTPETGGWSTREMRILLQELAGLNIVGADVVEVAPAYDVQEITGLAAADLVHELVSLMVISRADEVGEEWQQLYPTREPWYMAQLREEDLGVMGSLTSSAPPGY